MVGKNLHVVFVSFQIVRLQVPWAVLIIGAEKEHLVLPARFASIHHAARPKKGARHEANDLQVGDSFGSMGKGWMYMGS